METGRFALPTKVISIILAFVLVCGLTPSISTAYAAEDAAAADSEQPVAVKAADGTDAAAVAEAEDEDAAALAASSDEVGAEVSAGTDADADAVATVDDDAAATDGDSAVAPLASDTSKSGSAQTKAGSASGASSNAPSAGSDSGTSSSKQPSSDKTVTVPPAEHYATPAISASAHVQTYGWQRYSNVKPDTLIGTEGKKKRVEGIRLSLSNKSGLSGSIQYRAYVQKLGWQKWVSDGALAGTTGKKLRVEAIQVRLTGDLAKHFDVYYQTHVQKLGWLAWAKGGSSSSAIAGSSQLAYRMESLRIQLVPKGGKAPYSTASKAFRTAEVKTRGHIQKTGTVKTNYPYLTSTATIGTTGQKRQLEAFSVAFGKKGVSYQAHVAKRGWLSSKSDGALAGTTGQRLGIQAVKVSLTGDLANDYDIYYRVHASKIGWMGWAKNGEVAGTVNCSRPIEALQVKLVKKGASAPGSTTMASLDRKAMPVSLTTGSSKGGSWSDVTGGSVVGSVNKKALTGIRMKISNSAGLSGGIRYQGHYAKSGWTGWAANGGNSSSKNALQAMRIQLTGDYAKYFDVYYRTHVVGYGWMGWAKNGAKSGTTGLGKNVDAYQVRIMAKGYGAPGSTAKVFSDKNGFLAPSKVPAQYRAFQNRANRYSSNTNWIILVDTHSNQVAIFQGRKGAWNLNRVIPCTSGAAGTPTVKGEFSVTGKGYSFGSGYTCYYYTQFFGNYLFHSVLYYQGTFQVMDGRLGINASHGCVRLAVDQAKWIYDHIPYGTKVVTY